MLVKTCPGCICCASTIFRHSKDGCKSVRVHDTPHCPARPLFWPYVVTSCPVQQCCHLAARTPAGAHPDDAPHEGHCRHAAPGLHRRVARRRRRGPVHRSRPAGERVDPQSVNADSAHDPVLKHSSPGRTGCRSHIHGRFPECDSVRSRLSINPPLQAALARSEVIDFHQTLDIDGIKVMTMHGHICALCTGAQRTWQKSPSSACDIIG